MTTAKDYVAHQQGLSSLQRPRYSAGLLLEDEDLTAAVDYTRDMMRLLFRSLFGCGVVCGLDVKALLTCKKTQVEVSIGKGLALDCAANPIHIPKPITVIYDASCEDLPAYLWVTVCYVEKCCRPKDLACSPDDDGRTVHTRSLDGFEVRLYKKRPVCVCTCEPPDPNAEQDDDDCCDPRPKPKPKPGSASSSATDARAAALVAAGQPNLAGLNPAVAGMPGANELIGRAALHQAAGNSAEPGVEPGPRWPCPCFQKHYDGVCACACGCSCVVIGKIDLAQTDEKKPVKDSEEKSIALLVDRTIVRWIRPVLVGYMKCFEQPVEEVPPVLEPAEDPRDKKLKELKLQEARLAQIKNELEAIEKKQPPPAAPNP